MKLTYTVTENDYIRLLTQLIRKKDRRPFAMVTLFLLTAGQMILIAWLCVYRLERERWAFFIVWSVLIAAFTVLRRCTVRARARGTLYRLKANAQLPADYWKPHRLEETEDGLRLTYGDVRMLCPPGHFGGYEEHDELLYLYADAGIFDIIPAAALASPEKKKTICAGLDAFRGRAPELPPELSEPAGDAVELTVPFGEGEYLRAQVSAYRTMYARYQLAKPNSLVKLAVSVFLIVYAASRPSAGIAALAAALCLLLNRDHLMAFTPLAGLRIRRELGAWSDSREITLSASPAGIRQENGDTVLFVPYESISLSENGRVGRIFSWGRLPAIVVPGAVCQSAEGKAFLDQVASGRSLRPFPSPRG